MSKNSLGLMTLAALLAACSAAAQNADRPAQKSAEPALLGAPEPVPAPVGAPAAAAEAPPEPLRAAPAPREHAAHNDAAAVTCDVRTRRTENGLLIQARAFADRDIAGEYDLAITKSGGGNSSEINQSGPVSIRAGSMVTLGENEISVERGARLRAVLTLRDADGTLCRQSFNL